ncbi:MAG: sensor histidine kinase N-terminal domain-containing protein, partial [Aliishimia sp.]
MKRPASIRKRLFYQLAAVAAVLSLAFVLVVRGVASRAAEGTQDDILAASATAIADSLTSEQGEVTLELPYSALSMLGTINEDRVFYRITVNDSTLTGYADLPANNLPTRLDTPVFSTEVYRGDEVRLTSILRRVSNTAAGSQVVVTVAQTRSGLAAISRRITITATGVGLLFFLLATTLSLLAANSALRPLNRMTGTVARRGPSDLRPVTGEAPTELTPLVDALNSFMARLRSSLS